MSYASSKSLWGANDPKPQPLDIVDEINKKKKQNSVYIAHTPHPNMRKRKFQHWLILLLILKIMLCNISHTTGRFALANESDLISNSFRSVSKVESFSISNLSMMSGLTVQNLSKSNSNGISSKSSRPDLKFFFQDFTLKFFIINYMLSSHICGSDTYGRKGLVRRW